MTFHARLLPDTRRRVFISVNPCAGARDRLDLIERLAAALEAQGLEPAIVESPEQLAEFCCDPAISPQVRAVVAGGGDGTVSYLANRLPPETPLAILPLGTENLLAKYLQIACDPVALAAMIARGETIAIDAGLAGERLFLLMAGIGFDAEVVRRMHDQRRGGHIHHLSYVKPIFEAIRNYQYPEVRLTCRDGNGQTHEVQAKWAFVINVPRYAAGLAISPEAQADDGLLNVCTFKEGSLLRGLVYLSGIILGQHQNWNDCVTLRASEVRIESSEPVPYQLDGDPGGYLPVDIRILPKRLTLLVPESWSREHVTPLDSPTHTTTG